MESSPYACDMESSSVDSIRALERAEAAPYVQTRPSPRWAAPLCGVWFAAYVGAFTFWRENQLAFIVVMLGLSAGMGAFAGWLARRYGAFPMPGRGTPPPEIRREYRRYGVGVVGIALIVAILMWRVGVPTAAGAAFALVTAGVSLFQARYERAAAVVRKRLA